MTTDRDFTVSLLFHTQAVIPTGFYIKKDNPEKLRRITYFDVEKNGSLFFSAEGFEGRENLKKMQKAVLEMAGAPIGPALMPAFFKFETLVLGAYR